jgi:hypothetical protein
MFFRRRNKVLIAKNARVARDNDPLSAFKNKTRGEISKYEIRGEVWKSVKKLLWFAGFLVLFYFLRECYFAWNIFQ